MKEVYLRLQNPVETDVQLDPDEVIQAKNEGRDGYWVVEDGLIDESEIAVFDPKQIKSAIQEGMAEGEKALAEAKAQIDNPLVEPESAPQIAAEPVAPPVPAVPVPAAEEKPAKAVAAG